MAAQGIVSQASSLNAIVILSCPIPGILSVPIPIVGFGVQDMLTIDDTEPTNVEIGLDSAIVAFVRPTLVSGRMTLIPNSPATQAILNVQRINLTGFVVPLTLTVSDYNGLWEYSYSDFFITSAFKGYELRERVQDWTVSFKANLPQATILGAAASAALAGISVLGSI